MKKAIAPDGKNLSLLSGVFITVDFYFEAKLFPWPFSMNDLAQEVG
jgi:hypothetical protein